MTRRMQGQYLDKTQRRDVGYRQLIRLYVTTTSMLFLFLVGLISVGIATSRSSIPGPWLNILSFILISLGGTFTFFQFLFLRHSQQFTATPTVTYHSVLHNTPLTDPKIILQREQLVESIYAQLIQCDITAIVLTGIAGVGKSTLAALVHDYAEEQRRAGKKPFTAEALWLRVDNNVTTADLTITIFTALGQPMPDLSNLAPQNQALALYNAMNSVEDARLIILDQFENLLDWETGSVLNRSGVGEWLDVLNSQPCHCRVLLTSRLWPQGTRKYPPNYMKEQPVEGLTINEGKELLRKQGVEATEQELSIAVERCAGHAYALQLLASLIRDHQLSLSSLFNDPIYTQLWTGNIAQSLLDYLYKQQLDPVQRNLLLAFAVFREGVPLDAAKTVFAEIPKMQIISALNVLLAQHLLQATGEGRYQLHPIVANYALTHFDESNQQANQEALRKAHLKAAQYYLRQAANCPPREKGRQRSDVHPFVEAIWHQCKADQWKKAYDLMDREFIFLDLKRWGGNATLLELYQSLLPLATQHPESKEGVCIYSNLGRIHRTLGQRELALDYFKRALSIYEKNQDHRGEGTIHSFLGSVYADLGQKEEAQLHLEQALKIRTEIGDREGEGWTLDNLSRIYHELGQEAQALESGQQALDIFEKQRDHKGEGRALNSLGRIYDNLGKKDPALQYYNRALTICREVGDRLGEGLTLNGLGLIYIDLGQKDKALQILNDSLLIRREVSDRGGEGRTLNNLGRVYSILGQKEKAREYFENALSVCKEIGDREGVSKVLNSLSMIQPAQEAYKYLEEALDICQEVKDRRGEAWTLHNLGRVYTSFGQKHKAQKYYEQALRLRREVGDRRGEAWTLHNLGLLYFEHYKDNKVALAFFLLTREIFREIQSVINYGVVEDNIRRLQEAIGKEQFHNLLATTEPEASQIVERALLHSNT
jgi:tetratricopeptide (TPR) repeat protein